MHLACFCFLSQAPYKWSSVLLPVHFLFRKCLQCTGCKMNENAFLICRRFVLSQVFSCKLHHAPVLSLTADVEMSQGQIYKHNVAALTGRCKNKPKCRRWRGGHWGGKILPNRRCSMSYVKFVVWNCWHFQIIGFYFVTRIRLCSDNANSTGQIESGIFVSDLWF